MIFRTMIELWRGKSGLREHVRNWRVKSHFPETVLSPFQVACHSAELHFPHVLGKHCCAAVKADKFKGWPGSDLNSSFSFY